MENLIRNVPDFPIKGVMFRDITDLLASPPDFTQAIEEMVKHVDLSKVDYIAGVESRGFILASAMAQRFNKGFLPIRKAGKLPPPVEAISYSLEYGKATLEMRPGKGRVLVVDDVLATSGTLKAAITLCERSGFEVVDLSVLIDLRYLNSFTWNEKRVHSVLKYE